MTTEVRTTLVLPAHLAKAIDDYWHTKRLNSRPEAIRELLTDALEMWSMKPIRPAKEKAQ